MCYNILNISSQTLSNEIIVPPITALPTAPNGVVRFIMPETALNFGKIRIFVRVKNIAATEGLQLHNAAGVNSLFNTIRFTMAGKDVFYINQWNRLSSFVSMLTSQTNSLIDRSLYNAGVQYQGKAEESLYGRGASLQAADSAIFELNLHELLFPLHNERYKLDLAKMSGSTIIELTTDSNKVLFVENTGNTSNFAITDAWIQIRRSLPSQCLNAEMPVTFNIFNVQSSIQTYSQNTHIQVPSQTSETVGFMLAVTGEFNGSIKLPDNVNYSIMDSVGLPDDIRTYVQTTVCDVPERHTNSQMGSGTIQCYMMSHDAMITAFNSLDHYRLRDNFMSFSQYTDGNSPIMFPFYVRSNTMYGSTLLLGNKTESSDLISYASSYSPAHSTIIILYQIYNTRVSLTSNGNVTVRYNW